MKVLYIDTSSSYLYAGIVSDNTLISSIVENLGTELSKVALPKITSMFESTNLNPSDIDKIIVVNGPGSFTGIRVGLTIAKVFAWALNIPITTISGLEAMKESTSTDLVVVPLIDARRNYSYAAIYDGDTTILEPSHIENTKLDEILNSVGDYLIVTNSETSLEGEKCSYQPDILKIVQKYVEKEDIHPHMVNPEYLKLTEAEEKNNHDS